MPESVEQIPIPIEKVSQYIHNCRTDPTKEFVKLIWERLSQHNPRPTLDEIRESVVCDPGKEPESAPWTMVGPVFNQLLLDPSSGFGQLVRDHFSATDAQLPDTMIRVASAKMRNVEIPMNERLKGAFDRLDPETRAYFIDVARQNWTQAESDLSRSVLLSLFLAGVFELFVRAVVSRVDVLGFEIADYTLPLRFLPIASAFLFVRIAMAFNAVSQYQQMHTLMINEVHPELYARDLETHLGHGLTNVWHGSTWFNISVERTVFQKIYNALTGTLVALTVLSPPIVVISMYIRLFVKSGVGDLVTWLSAAVSLIFLTMGFVFWIAISLPEARRTAQRAQQAAI